MVKLIIIDMVIKIHADNLFKNKDFYIVFENESEINLKYIWKFKINDVNLYK